MLKIKLLSMLCILAFPFICFGQEGSQTVIKGKLLAETKGLYLETVYVYNKQSSKGILSDSLGNFKLAVRLGDTIAISAMHIEPKEIVVEKMHLNDVFITLPIKANIAYLKEVRLSNRSLTGSLDLDMRMLPINPVITTEDLGYSDSGTIPKEIRLLDIYYSGNTEHILAIISGNLIRTLRRKGIVDYEKKRQNIIKRIPNSFYTSYLKVTQENISHFIDFCESENDLDYLIDIPIDDFMGIMEKTVALYKRTHPDRFQ